ncbi:MAG: hypothetical protein ACYS7Y_17625 [Planctomycetota bacterium]
MKSDKSTSKTGRPELRYPAPQIAMLVTAMLFVGGCGQREFRTLGTARAPTAGRRSKAELRETLDTFEELALDRMREAATELDELSPTSKRRRRTVLWRTRGFQALHSVSSQEDPVIAFIDTWTFAARMTHYFETGEGSSMFGEDQHVAIETSKELELEIEEIAETYMDEKVFKETRRTIQGVARANPIKGTLSNMVFYATQIKEGEPGYFDAVAGIPMAPFRALEGVDRTPVAINRFTDTAQNFADVVEGLPESARWQLLLLMYDLEESDMAQSFLGSMAEFSKSSARMADTAEKMPEQLRKQLSVFVEEVDAKQENLQTTLDKAEKTAASVERSVKLADQAGKSFGETAQIAIQTANAWEKTAEAANQAIREFKAGQPEDKEPLDIKELHATAETARIAVNDVRALVAEVRDLAESDELAAHASAIQTLSAHVAWLVAILILLVFVLALVYRIIVVRIVGKRKQQV